MTREYLFKVRRCGALGRIVLVIGNGGIREVRLGKRASEAPGVVGRKKGDGRIGSEESGRLGRYAERFFEEVGRLLRGERPCFDELPVDFGKAPVFSRRVWEECRRIPWGETRTYGWLAERIGKPRAARAVGAALRANPVPLIVPCHRVVGSDGRLGGFRPGLEMKKKILQMERQVT
ncbi:MAG: methylated-DNA--[protein]-cysteine S-methyltransferase [Candidatus Hydrogenedentota bacterium]|nr:MAG: methylated-DNA--[protein]-cysteine S-methyltransferase [Candidatus Hydrogenedentota bacterium]